ncbi:hypothetical protein FM036_45170 [Nostoc sp. HG1]|nr:hypothetical protein [Nostoc sp. HG1]
MTSAIRSPKSFSVPSSWHALQPIWQGGEEVVQCGLPKEQLATTWQMLLLGDGSHTRNLQLFNGRTC